MPSPYTSHFSIFTLHFVFFTLHFVFFNPSLPLNPLPFRS